MSSINRNITIVVRGVDQGLSTSLNKVAGEAQKVTGSVGAMKAPLDQTGASMAKVTAEGTKTQGTLSKIGAAFSGNRGLVFGFAGLSSAIAEAVGMLDMYGSAAQMVEEDQAKLNQLQEDGVTTGKAYTDAVSELNKHERFLNMTRRNTALSLMDNVFFTTMAINGLIKMNQEGGALSGVMGKLKNSFTGLRGTLSTTTNSFANFMNAFSPLPTTMQSTSKAASQVGPQINQIGTSSAISATKVLALSGALAGIGLAAAGIAMVLTKAEELKNGLNEAFAESLVKINVFSAGILQMRVALGIATEEEKRMLEEVKKGMELTDQAMKNLNITSTDLFVGGPELAKKLVDEIVRLGKEGDNTATVLAEKFQDPIDSLTAYNNLQKEQRQLYAAAKPYVNDFMDIIERQGVSWTLAKDDVKGYADQLVAGGAVSEDVADIIEHFLNLALDNLIAKEKEAAKASEELIEKLKGLPSIGERVTGFMTQWNAGSQQAAGWLNEVGLAVEAWKTKNADNIPMLEKTGQLTNVLTKDLAAHFSQYMDGESAMMLATIGAALFSNEQKNVKKTTEDANKELFEAADILSDLLDEYNEVATATKKFMDITGLTQSQMERMGAIHDETTGRIQAQSQAITDNAGFWDRLTESEIKNTEAAFENIIAWAKTNDMLMSNREWQFKVKDAQTQGLVAAKLWTQETMLEAKSAEFFRTNLINLNQGILAGIDTTGMLTSEIQALIEHALLPAAEKVDLFKRAIADLTKNSRSVWSSVIGAEDKKGFKDAFKDMDLGAIPRKIRDDVKDLFEGIRDDAEKGKEVEVAFSAITASMTRLGDNLSKGQIKKIFEQGVKVFDRGAGSVNVFGQSVSDLILGPMTDLGKQELYDKLESMPGTFDKIRAAQSDGIITYDEYRDIMFQYSLEGGKLKDLTDEQREALAKMGIIVDENTGKIDASKLATQQYSEEMAKIEVNAIVVKTIGKMWGDLARMIMEANLVLTQNWADTTLGIAEMASILIVELAKGWAALVKGLHTMNVALANSWEKAMKNIAHNSEAASSQTNSTFASLVKKLNSHFVKIANNFEKAMRNIAQNAKAAASQANSALAGIKDRTVKINYVETGAVPGKSKGGFHSFAEGGMLHASRGLTTTVGPRVLFGDNTGGKETAAFIPNNEPYRSNVLDQIDQMFGRSRGDINVRQTPGQTIIINDVIKIGDEQIPFQRTYRIRQGQEVASQVL